MYNTALIYRTNQINVHTLHIVMLANPELEPVSDMMVPWTNAFLPVCKVLV